MPVRLDSESQCLDDKKAGTYGDFRDTLLKDGFVVIPSVMTPEAASSYVDAAHEWLEQYGSGYKRSDPSTWKRENVPWSNTYGMYNRNNIGHEQFVWNVRQEPKILEVFEKVWGTNELLVSFDGANISIPLDMQKEEYAPIAKPWPHVDQSPLRPNFYCVQGIANLAPSGPKDGGLTVLKGSSALYTEFFKEHEATDMPADGWSYIDKFMYNDRHMEWFYARGCEWVKPVAQPGDLLLWDSRTCHYGAPPMENNARVACYVTYKPAVFASPEVIANRIDNFHAQRSTGHDPCTVYHVKGSTAPGQAIPVPKWGKEGVYKKAELNEVGRKLVGLDPY